MDSEYVDCECTTCGKIFDDDYMVDITRAFERVHYFSPDRLNEVEVTSAEAITGFCSNDCLVRGRTAVMAGQKVPIPAVRPGIGPIERCAKCSGPVDMSNWHLTYTENECDYRGVFVQVLDSQYIAVVCKSCAPGQEATIEEAQSSSEEGQRTTTAIK